MRDIITCAVIHLDGGHFTLKFEIAKLSQLRYIFLQAEGHVRKLHHPIFAIVRFCSAVKTVTEIVIDGDVT